MDDNVIQIVATALVTATKVSAPVLVTALAVGLLLSIVQSATQVQEATLTFLPKLAAAAVALVVSGSWALRVLTGFTHQLFALVPTLLGAG